MERDCYWDSLESPVSGGYSMSVSTVQIPFWVLIYGLTFGAGFDLGDLSHLHSS